jgi:histidyl-tRNA synthetase
MKTEIVKGFKDYTGKEAEKLSEIKKIVVETFERYGFEPAITPIIEYEDFVKEGNEQDEAVSDIFRLNDKGERELALRYEFTFQLKRLSKNKKLPYKRYQIGEVFRDEPVGKARLRQFTQADADVVGSTIKEEAEILAMTTEILKKIGIKPTILINSRKLMNEILRKEGIKNIKQVLREIDKYGKIPEKLVIENLKKYGAEKLIALFKQGDKFFSKFSSYKDIGKLKDYCKIYGVNVVFSPTVVRGLSYYNGSVFEIKAKGLKDTVVAGGSYKIGSNQATGISLGLERLSLIAEIKREKEKNLVVSLNKDQEAIGIAEKLRKSGRTVSVYYGKPSKALEYANSYGFTHAIFVGKEETKSGEYKIKNLKTGGQARLEF